MREQPVRAKRKRIQFKIEPVGFDGSNLASHARLRVTSCIRRMLATSVSAAGADCNQES
jgi:hypothetical protein